MLSRESGLYVDQPCFSKIIMILVTSPQNKMTLRQFNTLNKQMSKIVYLNDFRVLTITIPCFFQCEGASFLAGSHRLPHGQG